MISKKKEKVSEDAAAQSFGDDMRIDAESLDYEWLRQADLYAKYGRMKATAMRRHDQLNAEFDLMSAELDSKVRSAPEKYGIAKITETAIKSSILCVPEYQEKLTQIRDAALEVELLAVAIRTLEHKRSALENLVRLAVSNYFSLPSIPHNLSELVNTKESARQKMYDRLNAE
jgi:hypothetical protein